MFSTALYVQHCIHTKLLFAALSAHGASIFVCHSGNGSKAGPRSAMLRRVDGIVDYTGNGTLAVDKETGDRGQNYSWGSIGYGDYMYIGTCYGAWMNTLQLMKAALGRDFDDDVMKEALDTYYHGELYTAEGDGAEALGILVKLNVATGESKKLCKNYNGIPESAEVCGQYLDKATFGFDLYVTEDGVNFTKITDNGFGDPYNHGLRAFGITDRGLYIGTANPFYGTQVWQLREEE